MYSQYHMLVEDFRVAYFRYLLYFMLKMETKGKRGLRVSVSGAEIVS